MFATLLGALPPPVADFKDIDRLIEIAIRAQEDAGLEPITDGRLRHGPFERIPSPQEAVQSWQAAQQLTDRAVKQALPGPYSLDGTVSPAAIAEVAQALGDARCPLVEIEEMAVDRLGDPRERALFREAHARLLDGVTGTHMSLSIVGAAPHPNAWATVLDLPYASLAVDLIDGPDNWNLVTRLAGARGVIAGVESARGRDEPKELLLWAAHYAASTQGRGMDRVGLGSAGSWANLTWEVAVRKMRVLGEAARLAVMPPSAELAASLDPRGVSSRAAALGGTGRSKPKLG